MAALLPLYFDVVSKRLVFSETNARSIILPDLHNEDNFTIDFRALKRVRVFGPTLFQRVQLNGYSLAISIGPAGTIHAAATSWVLSDSDTLLTGNLDLATAGIAALADGASTIFEIKLSTGGLPYTGQFPVTIRKRVATSGALNPVVNDTALGIREADRTYVRKEMRAGEGILFTSGDGLSQCLGYLHDDKSMRFEEVA